MKLIGCWLAAAIYLTAQQAPYAAKRARMVRDQIEAQGIRNAAVLEAMRITSRELFMPADVRAFAYEDRAVPIGYGQTISQPYIVAFMTELLDIKKDHRVLEIGTGSGYQAAVLSALAKEVYSIEIVPQLAKSAFETLSRLGYKNVVLRQGDGYKGWPDQAPFDRIILTAAPPQLPKPLTDQLKPGGKLLAPVGSQSHAQELYLVEKGTDGSIRSRPVLPVRFVPMVRPSGQ